MNKKNNLMHVLEVLNSLDRLLEAWIEKVTALKFIQNKRPQPVPVRAGKHEHPF